MGLQLVMAWKQSAAESAAIHARVHQGLASALQWAAERTGTGSRDALDPFTMFKAHEVWEYQ